MAAHTKLWYLERFRLLDALTDEQKRAVEQSTRMLELGRGRRIYLAGDVSDQVFLLKTGIVKIYTSGEQQDLVLAFLYPGDIFGELALIDDSPHDEIAEVVEDAVLCALNRDVLVRLIRQTPSLGYEITKLMGRRLRRFRTRVEELLYKSAHARVANTLLDLAADYGIKDADGVLIPIRLKQSELGSLVGLARETVNIVLQDLKQRGLVEASRTSIRLKDPERLRGIS
jgi:CRP-like cAMP-binding protein